MDNSVCVVVGVYGRPKLDHIFFRQVKRFKAHGWDTIIVGSEDEFYADLQYSNENLHAKYNYAIDKTKDYDNVLLLGSDDFMSNELIKTFQKDINLGIDYISMTEIHLYNGRLYKWKGYKGERVNESVGAFRCISKAVLKKLQYTPFNARYSMDSGFNRKLNKIKGLSRSIVTGFTVDVKYKGTSKMREIGITGYVKKVDVRLMGQIPEYKYIRKLFNK